MKYLRSTIYVALTCVVLFDDFLNSQNLYVLYLLLGIEFPLYMT